MVQAFITIRFLDIIDILVVAFLLYQLYNLLKGTVALNIFAGLLFVYLFWLLVKALSMHLLSTIIGQFIGVGVIALLIVFQQELRRFLIILGTRYFTRKRFSFERFFKYDKKKLSNVRIISILKALSEMSANKTGALIVLAKKSDLEAYMDTGDRINALTSSRLLESIFFKNNPLHDGAVIIKGDKIIAARCILPITENMNVPPNFGMRHRAAMGLTEKTDAIVLLVSEETGKISIAESGEIQTGVKIRDVQEMLEMEFPTE